MPDTLMQTPGPQSAKPWLQSYPPGMPSHIDPLPYNSIGDLFVQSCKNMPIAPPLPAWARR